MTLQILVRLVFTELQRLLDELSYSKRSRVRENSGNYCICGDPAMRSVNLVRRSFGSRVPQYTAGVGRSLTFREKFWHMRELLEVQRNLHMGFAGGNSGLLLRRRPVLSRLYYTTPGPHLSSPFFKKKCES